MSTQAAEAMPESAPVESQQVDEPEAAVDPIMANPPPPRERQRQEGSRRAEAEQKRIAEAVAAATRTHAEELSRVRGEFGNQISQLNGSVQTMQQMLQQREQAAQQQKPAEEDTDTIRQQARKALDEGNFDLYSKMERQAAVIEARKAAREEYQRLAPQQPQGMPPQIMALMAHHRHVALAGPVGMQWVEHKARELELSGEQPGPALVQKAFAAAEKILEAKANATSGVNPQQFSQASASVLSSVPTSRGPAGTTGQGSGKVRLTELEKEVAKKCGMSVAEYERHLAMTHPERVDR